MSRFRDGRTVESSISEVINGDTELEDIPLIEVVRNPTNNTWWSLDNRRLFVFRTLFEEDCLESVPCDDVTDKVVFQKRWENLKSGGNTVRVRPLHVSSECEVDYFTDFSSRTTDVMSELRKINSTALSDLTNILDTRRQLDHVDTYHEDISGSPNGGCSFSLNEKVARPVSRYGGDQDIRVRLDNTSTALRKTKQMDDLSISIKAKPSSKPVSFSRKLSDYRSYSHSLSQSHSHCLSRRHSHSLSQSHSHSLSRKTAGTRSKIGLSITLLR
ncbi:uncharacterized protein LOC134819938 isoform X2 [Bolinopsis microptera]|uniref:uncharacterized protein LOC134819938 isoform X2 n=1 Tax=Bolinopsis microptera TaxID=2820187 RepID=UPI00307B0EB5